MTNSSPITNGNRLILGVISVLWLLVIGLGTVVWGDLRESIRDVRRQATTNAVSIQNNDTRLTERATRLSLIEGEVSRLQGDLSLVLVRLDWLICKQLGSVDCGPRPR